MASIGQPLPAATLYDGALASHNLSELAAGKPTVLLFFPAAYTRVCEKELCTVRDGLLAYSELGAQVYGISVDMPWTLANYAKQLGVQYPLLSDSNREAVKALGLEINLRGIQSVSQRAAFVLDGSNALRWQWIAENPGQEPPYEEVVEVVKGL